MHNQVAGDGILGMVLSAGPVVKFIMAGLLCLSIACWCIIALKLQAIWLARKHTEQFITLFRLPTDYSVLYDDCKKLADSYLAGIFRIGHEELGRISRSIAPKNTEELAVNHSTLLENVERAMNGGITLEMRRFEKFLPFLATTGSTAPFIGLFGTVWGIMSSFQEIGMKGVANLSVVAPGISEALVATAMGLAAAIPAVIAYNHFAHRLRSIEREMNQFATDYLNLLKRDMVGGLSRDNPS